jgi:hypothetical protein
MKAYWGSEVELHTLTSALDGVSGQLNTLDALPPWERAPGSHRIGGWVHVSQRCGEAKSISIQKSRPTP